MAGSSLLALIDDIASLLDDVATMTKLAAKNAVGALGDDMALNAQQVSGVNPDRELPVVWAVAKGSMKNKAILVPAALLISAVARWAIIPILMCGGAYLSFEGFEKLAHYFKRDKASEKAKHTRKIKAIADPDVDIVALEKGKIKGAIRTDFILSAEIIVIALGAVRNAVFLTQVLAMVGVAVIMTIGVYGVVASIVKFDDVGIYLLKDTGAKYWNRFKRFLGRGILHIAPHLLKTLSIAGTAAMFMVGGGILLHGFPGLSHALHPIVDFVHKIPVMGGFMAVIAPTLMNMVAGIIAGGIVLFFVTFAAALLKKFKKKELSGNKKKK